MTKDELLAMPGAAYMDAVQIAFFQALLKERVVVLRERYVASKAQLENMEPAADPADQAVIEEQRIFVGRAMQRDAAEVQLISSILGDMSGYGYSDLSGEPIGLERLLVCPTAQLTVEEQNRHERHQLHLAKAG
ncbi:conjugal transfer protein TraR [Pseudomonas aeruginosa]|uniref:TraR/DksA family transcriptional regulator n=1 Tax=Pseudomonas aeruginosa TaxID=287 RepID=UPI000FFE9855|nr:TraR/DksA family transcriptional regulator [Pseudomonas aeruginosa]MBA5107606.1 TraR/DksA family transcriptional regulator [Pseudomonas aeruginosa]MBD1300856.1 TraR/DksA family transcriptional regulator [Pseudomonas aeruginosa]MBD1341619.1 TraR/DksA family transcriptional regulator [Pseudomonas aeruginosa]MDP5993421.1 TraR/DksA family transcriptional regulator [Pseudomonas aeruginosa]RRS17161.1 conjugal transfer protein TraR [Pseudomonas aeruginosa]